MISSTLTAGCNMSYYKEHAKEFIENTKDSDMSALYSFFEAYLSGGGTILDIGFGSGRDSLYFISKGYTVYAIDPEEEFVKYGKEIGLTNVEQLRAEDINYENIFDGIWACASLLHISSAHLNDVFKRCSKALKEKGVMYVSFKLGAFEGTRNGRFYLDLTENSLQNYLADTGLSIKETKITKDVRPERDELWLNAILIKDD